MNCLISMVSEGILRDCIIWNPYWLTFVNRCLSRTFGGCGNSRSQVCGSRGFRVDYVSYRRPTSHWGMWRCFFRAIRYVACCDELVLVNGCVAPQKIDIFTTLCATTVQNWIGNSEKIWADKIYRIWKGIKNKHAYTSRQNTELQGTFFAAMLNRRLNSNCEIECILW